MLDYILNKLKSMLHWFTNLFLKSKKSDKNVVLNFGGKINSLTRDDNMYNFESPLFGSDMLKKTLQKKRLIKDNDNILFNEFSKIENATSPPYYNGLLGTIAFSYSRHIPLKLRPDDLYNAIIVSYCKYIEKNAEKLRNKIVDFEGKKDLEYMTAKYDDKEFINKLFEMSQNNVSNFKINAETKFSTTSEDDILFRKLASMNATKHYFNYIAGYDCGIPRVTLLGTLNDWKLLCSSIDFLKQLDIKELNDWHKILQHVLNKILDSFDGNVDNDFWSRICTAKSFGSGGEKEFRGWFLVFSPFDKNCNYVLHDYEKIMKEHLYGTVADGDIMDSYISVDGKVNLLHEKYDITIHSMTMTLYDENSNDLYTLPARLTVRGPNKI